MAALLAGVGQMIVGSIASDAAKDFGGTNNPFSQLLGQLGGGGQPAKPNDSTSPAQTTQPISATGYTGSVSTTSGYNPQNFYSGGSAVSPFSRLLGSSYGN